MVWATAIDPMSNAPLPPATAFPVEARTIYATLPVARIAQGTVVAATWSYNGTPLDGFLGSVSAPQDERDVWLEFHIGLAGPEPWPAGVYAVAVRVDGQPAQSAAVAVGATAAE